VNTDELPEGWAESLMGDIATVTGGGTPTANDPTYFTERGIAWITPADLSDFSGVHIQHGRRFLTEAGYNACSAKLLPKGAVLMSSRAPIGYVAIAANELCTNQGFKSFVLKPCVLPEFAFHWLRFMRDEIEDMGSGSTFLEVSGSKCKEIPIRFPPLAEQRRIVAAVERILDKVTAARARLDRVPTTLKRFRQAVLAAACSGRLTADWREKNPCQQTAEELLEVMAREREQAWAKRNPGRMYRLPEDVEKEELPEIPGSWAWTNFDHCAWEITVGHVGPMKDRYVPEGVPFLRSQNVRPLRFDVGGLVKIAPDFHASLRKSALHGGEILITRSGANTGDCCVLPANLGNANCADLVVTRPLTGLVAQFGAIYVSSPEGQERIGLQETGMAQPHFNIGAMRVKPFPLPPLVEQQEIVRRVSALFARADAIEATVTAARKRVDTLTPAVLSKAFRGELVPTEAELARRENRPYESAADLLARVRASATDAHKSKRTRKAKGISTP
jgi:type I restriction enzyme S subunit